MDAATYHHDAGGAPSLSASIAHTLLAKSPQHAWHEHPRLNPMWDYRSEAKFDLGTAAHSLLLEGVEPTVIEAPDWKSKAAQEARAEARAQGLVPLLAPQAVQQRRMVSAIREQLDRLDIDLHPFMPTPFTDGKPEQVIVWKDAGEVLCRARADWLRDDRLCIDDLKTTAGTANPAEWARRPLWNIGADIQAAFYTRGIETLTGHRPDFRFIVVETDPPFALSVISLAPDALALADAKIDRALTIWKRCLETDQWPGYAQRTHYAELPLWEEARWMERTALEDMS